MATTFEAQPASPPRSATMHADEWQARVQLAACYRIFDLLGWTEMIYNHITLRVRDSVSGAGRQFLINPAMIEAMRKRARQSTLR
ncbi:ribulose-5-phosphate 4-epimerase/fuculose-1-phosphate aldolase [Paraburkholderia sp. WC7.3g]